MERACAECGHYPEWGCPQDCAACTHDLFEDLSRPAYFDEDTDCGWEYAAEEVKQRLLVYELVDAIRQFVGEVATRRRSCRVC